MRFLAMGAILAAFPAFVDASQGIPRVSTRHFVREGLYEGGDALKTNLEGLRFASHPGGIERWVVDFSDASTRTVGKAAPRFQLRFDPAEPGVRAKARFVLSLRSIQGVYVSNDQLRGLARKSRYVDEVVLYPPVEDGDRVLELRLRQPVRFEPHQPLERAGRLVLDLKISP